MESCHQVKLHHIVINIIIDLIITVIIIITIVFINIIKNKFQPPTSW